MLGRVGLTRLVITEHFSWIDYLLLILSERVLGRSTSKRVVTGKDKRKIQKGRTEQIVEHKWRITSSTSRN